MSPDEGPNEPSHPARPDRGGTEPRVIAPFEVWGGIECTRVWIGDVTRDQLDVTGHARREDDLDRLAELGVQGVRYPVLWDRVAPNGLADADWSWPDRRLARLRELGIRPVVGLLHHGPGTRGATYLDPDFPARFADYAGAVARRYPWLDTWLPINEPLTTARFAGLYGFWWPHANDRDTFVRILLNQLLGVRAATRAIRAEIPGASVGQNEDIGRTRGTPPLAQLVRFHNVRRWLTFDLLTGRVDERHPMWTYLVGAAGAGPLLEDLRTDPCPPDLLGVDTYVTSERWLDHRVRHFPRESWSRDGHRRFADVESVRVVDTRFGGVARAMRETWRRYHLPIALSEVHLGGSSRDQLAWWHEALAAAMQGRKDGVDVRAITNWATFGLQDWTSLLREERGDYEPGAFDTRFDPPILTTLGEAVRATAAGAEARRRPRGWWRRADRAFWGHRQTRAGTGGRSRVTVTSTRVRVATGAPRGNRHDGGS
jgi:dTDP-4-dehydrorhamnose reductase